MLAGIKKAGATLETGHQLEEETLMKAEAAEAVEEEAEAMAAVEEVDPIHPGAEVASSATRKVTWQETARTLAKEALEEVAPVVAEAEELALSATRRVTWQETALMPMKIVAVEAEEEVEAAQVDLTEAPLHASNAKRRVTCLENARMRAEIREGTRDSAEMMEDRKEEGERITMEGGLVLHLDQTKMHGVHNLVGMHSEVTITLEETRHGETQLLMKYPLGVLSLQEALLPSRAMTLGALRILETLPVVTANGLATPRPKEAAGDSPCEC